MAELAKLSKCPRCGMNSTAGPNTGKHYRFCLTNVSCGLRTELCETPELAAEAWNSLCEQIRVGEEVLKKKPDNFQIGCMAWSPGRQIVTVACDFIPAPPSKDDVLRKIRTAVLAYEYLLHFVPEIDAVLGAEQ